jgi:hypothetical protein
VRLVTDDEIAAAFQSGLLHGLDPANRGVDGVAITTTDSLWLADYCDHCGHDFRLEDRVMVWYGPPLVVRHHSATLPCSGEAQTTEEDVDDARIQAFHRALDGANPPPEGVHAQRLAPGHPLLVAINPRLHCAFCSKTFREYEVAVVCPCSPADPKCQLGVHRDSGRGSDCYDAWTGSGRMTRCPTSFQKLT